MVIVENKAAYQNQYIAVDDNIDGELMKSMRKISSIEYIIKNRALGTVFYIYLLVSST